MKKLFSKKMMIVYIVLLCLTFISGTVSVGFSVHYSEKYNEAVKAAEKDIFKDETKSEAENFILRVIGSAISKEAGINTSSSVSDEGKAYRQSKSDAFIAAIVLYVFSVLSIAGIITCAQYDKYLKSEKYKAKLKRMKRYGNSYNTGM
jgi:hypothetical protein